MLNPILRILMILVVIAAVTVGWLSGAEVQAAPAPVTATGQTTPYAAGDDGTLRHGVAWPSPRFTEANGTVTDNLTGLVWLKDANCKETVGGIAKAGGTLTMSSALTWIKALAPGPCGLSDGSKAGDWRMPNIRELESLLDISQSSPSLPAGRPFSNVQAAARYSYYWSSSYYPVGMGAIWVVDMSDGSAAPDASQTNPYYVLPVRGGQSGSPVVSVSPTRKTFDNVTVGNSAAQTFTISNSGKANLIVSAISLAGMDPGLFSLTKGDGTAGSCGATPTLTPAGSCTISVSFTPVASVAYTATLRIASNDTVHANMDVTLIGIGATSPTTHTIVTAVVGGNGSIICQSPVNAGATSICTITPASSYHLADIVDNIVTLNNNVDIFNPLNTNTYNITNVSADHVVAGTFVHNATLNAFNMPATTTSLNVAVTTFDASYATNYLITEKSIAPDAGTFGWSATIPSSYTFSAAGNITAYAWAMDGIGNVTNSLTAPVSFPSLQAAYNSAAAANVDVHLGSAGSIPANMGTAPEFVADSGRTVTIAGGYNAANQTQGGESLVTGSMKIKSGKVIAAGVALRNP